LKRFITVLAAMGVVAAIFAGTAGAIAFADADYFWPHGEVGTPYTKQIQGRMDSKSCVDRIDHACKFALIAGSFPPGISITTDGLVSGTPQQLGTYDFWLEFSSIYGGAPAQREFQIVVDSVKLTVQGEGVLNDAFKGSAYSDTLSATGGSGPGTYTWSVIDGALPAGLTLAGNGAITGTPTTSGTASFTAQVKDANGKTDLKHLTVKVVDPLALKVSAGVAEVGRPYTATLQGSGGASGYKYTSVAGVPTGLTFDGSQTIQGTPTASGAAHVTVTLTDADGNAATLTVVVNVVPKLTVSTTHLLSTTAGRTYSARLRTIGGVRPFSWRISRGALPRGIRLATTTGRLSGHARRAGMFRFRVTVTDALGARFTRSLAISVG
jgi:hypothetical protein